MTTFKDHFSQVAGAYAHWRPTYPDALFDAITAVDNVGCAVDD